MPNLLREYWEKSFKSKDVMFKFDELEWISNSEFAFVISWIQALEQQGIKVSISLQSGEGLAPNSLTFKKREYCLTRIWEQWQLIQHLAPETLLIYNGITRNKKIKETFINFSAIPIFEYRTEQFDKDFDHLYSRYFTVFSSKLTKALENTEINLFDNQFLNYSIVKELYSNVCLHSESTLSADCYFSVGINRKFHGKSTFVSESRVNELSYLEKHYFTENGHYRNIDYVEINFHDVGKGIAETLRSKYSSESGEDLRTFFGRHYKVHSTQNIDSKVLEYSLLLFTSKFEIERKFEVHDYIPRGLFILKDIVKKYNGYIEIVSNSGAISLSFKDGKTVIRYGNQEKDTLLFPGTKIKIVFPSLEDDLSGNGNPINAYKATPLISEYKYESISFLKEYTEIDSVLRKEPIAETEEGLKVRLTGLLFSKILSSFRSKQQDRIVLLDFSGVEPRTIDFFNKFIYFATHFPLSSNSGLILCNLVTKGLNATIIYSDSNKLKSRGFDPYPIPCINIDLSVEWLGVKDESHSNNFTQIWIGNTKDEYVLDDISNYNSRIVAISREEKIFKIQIHLPSFEDVITEIESYVQSMIDDELKNAGIQFASLRDGDSKNYNSVIISKPNTVFLTASGEYLDKYISFNEKLYIYVFRRMIAGYLIFKMYAKEKDYSKIKKINKVLSVTLTSQLIGQEVTDILSILWDKEIELVALSNYLNFQNEEKFKEIKPKDSVLMVCDVVSTGRLTFSVMKAVEMNEASTFSCLSVVDLRSEPQDIANVSIRGLAKYELQHLDEPPPGSKIEFINAVANVPVSMPKGKSRENVLLSKQDFMSLIDEEFLIVGNLKSNSVFFNYYLQTHELLKKDYSKGFPLLKALLSGLRAQKQTKNLAELVYISKGLDHIGKNLSNSILAEQLNKVNKKITSIAEKLTPELFEDYQVDIVFYPFLSNINIIENDGTPFLKTHLNKGVPLIFPIPRIMTSRGWRFSFPPKFLNLVTAKKNLNALILDDGSLTGNTIMQMIDSVSFLHLKSIDVLSIFGRLEDFQKELFSRIKSVQVKGAVVPVNVFFGTHFDIPVHNSVESPFQKEANQMMQLDARIKSAGFEVSDIFGNFLKEQILLLENAESPRIGYDKCTLPPGVKKKDLFFIRDFLGRYDSYRLYSEDVSFESMNFLTNSREALLALLTVLNIEPNLYHTLKRFFDKGRLESLFFEILNNFLKDESLVNGNGMQLFLLKSLFYLNPSYFFKTETLLTICKSLYNHKNTDTGSCYRYIEYLLLGIKLNTIKMNDLLMIKSFEPNIEEFSAKLKAFNTDIFNELRFALDTFSQLQSQKTLEVAAPINKYYKLREYYNQAVIHENKHDDKLLTNLFKDVNKSISVLRYSFEKNLLKDEEENIRDLLQNLTDLARQYANHRQFGFIRDISKELMKFSNSGIEMDVEAISEAVGNLENLLKALPSKITSNSLNKIEESIVNYINSVLIVNSDFAKFIMASEASVKNEWNAVEKTFIDLNKGYVSIVPLKDDIVVKVNPYALNLAFENLISNKFTYAKEVSWSMQIEKSEEFMELTIEQQSAFKQGGGDGTGQSTIRTILKNFGVIYNKVSDNPYKLKITFT